MVLLVVVVTIGKEKGGLIAPSLYYKKESRTPSALSKVFSIIK
jgi:hypothetical protein